VTAHEEPQAAKTADRLREAFLVTLRELDRRAHRAMDVRGLMRDNRRVVLAAASGVPGRTRNGLHPAARTCRGPCDSSSRS